MLPSSGKTSPNDRRKRRHPLPICSEATLPDNSSLDGLESNCDGDFATDFSFSSARSVRRRLSVRSDDLQQPNSTPVVRPRKKRRLYMLEDSETLSHRLSVLSSSDRGEAAASSSGIPIPSNIEDLPNPEETSSLQLCKRCKPSALGGSRRLSRQLKQPLCSGDEHDKRASTVAAPSNGHKRTIFSPLNLGPPGCVCRYCGALFWYEERIDRRHHTTTPKYTKCCREGRVILSPYKPPPEPFYSLLNGPNRAISTHFFENIRYYNSMFAFTSMGVNVIDSINDGRGTYVFKISGQLYHCIGSLLPEEGRRPEYAQLYIFDTENELRNRLQLFRTARDRLSENSNDQYFIRLFGSPDKHGDIFSAPVASEVVGLVVDDLGTSDGGRDLLVEDKAGHLHRVDEKHCKFMAMQYPILFPYGEDGYHENINYRQHSKSKKIKHKHATMLEVFSYRLHDRADDFNTPLRCKRGTHAYIVDLYCCMEESRLSHYRTKSFQKKYRAASQKELRENVANGITRGAEAGQVMILPSSHIGSPRYLYQNYLDCVAICQKYGCPDLFITFTSNPYWSEVTEALARIPNQHPTDRADIVDRVFHMKLDIFMDDIVKKKFFGPVLCSSLYG